IYPSLALYFWEYTLTYFILIGFSPCELRHIISEYISNAKEFTENESNDRKTIFLIILITF
ncbi:hypothetical protein, partial [Xenorhabdus griffiniae]|uniref:hypothetical protein n=1 Tax=Xenorhabdus griffiniae TaxID=351672 RepID=UPI001D14423D